MTQPSPLSRAMLQKVLWTELPGREFLQDNQIAPSWWQLVLAHFLRLEESTLDRMVHYLAARNRTNTLTFHEQREAAFMRYTSAVHALRGVYPRLYEPAAPAGGKYWSWRQEFVLQLFLDTPREAIVFNDAAKWLLRKGRTPLYTSPDFTLAAQSLGELENIWACDTTTASGSWADVALAGRQAFTSTIRLHPAFAAWQSAGAALEAKVYWTSIPPLLSS